MRDGDQPITMTFLISLAKLAIYVSRMAGLGSSDHLLLDGQSLNNFIFYSEMNNGDEFKSAWYLKDELCLVEDEELVFGSLLN